MADRLTAAVFASGGGSNLQALLDHQSLDPPWRVGLVVSDREDAGALERAAQAGVATVWVPTRERGPDDVARDTLAALRGAGVDVIFLAGYMKLVPEAVVRAYRGKILNIHPALLPSFGGKGMYGMHVHRAVVASGARITGPTVHLVDEEYDRGPIVAQWPVPVLPGDTPEDVARRVLEAEHRLYPRAADHVCRAIAGGEEPGPLPWPDTRFSMNEHERNTGDQRSGSEDE
ncbi:MAG: phosphoribosylglycinamide formyltransferase [Gemmatimonadota bacterium]|nr:phosphoribosylglycinamide formyltransferase [Gemmatimonadota bacterium]